MSHPNKALPALIISLCLTTAAHAATVDLLAGSIPPNDAYVVKKLRDAGARTTVR